MQAGSKLRQWRQRQNMSQADMARRLQCHQTAISYFENGQRPSYNRMVAIRDLTGGEVDLADWTEPATAPIDAPLRPAAGARQ